MSKNKIGRWEVNFHEHFKYDENSPTGLVWARNFKNKNAPPKIGTPAGYNATGNSAGYWHVNISPHGYANHQVVWILHNGLYDTSKMKIDHIDGNTRNNKILNLRLVTMAVNLRNSKLSKLNSSGITGVHCSSRFSVRNQIHYETWFATWVNEFGKVVMKSFSGLRFENPKEMAIIARKEAIEHLNSLGLGYTENHGKPRQENNIPKVEPKIPLA